MVKQALKIHERSRSRAGWGGGGGGVGGEVMGV